MMTVWCNSGPFLSLSPQASSVKSIISLLSEGGSFTQWTAHNYVERHFSFVV
jgi:hypothetical protein